MGSKDISMRQISGCGVEASARAALELGNICDSPRRLAEEEKAAFMARVRTAPWMRQWRVRWLEQKLSGAQRVSPQRQPRYTQKLQAESAKRRAEADEWIKQVKARKKPGVKVKSGLHEGDRIK